MEINDLKKYHKNPRKITEKQHNLLEKTMQEFGDLSGVVVNIRNNEVVGGNQRTSIFQKYADEIVIEKTELPTPDHTGTVASGYIVFKGSKFAYREVDWDSDKEARANIIANKVGGFWDNDVLANEFDENLLLDSGFEDFELGIFDAKELNLGDREHDETTLDHSLDTYLDGSIKQIVLYFKKEEYDSVIERLEHLQEVTGASDFTELFKAMLDNYEDSKGL
jgi:hypothetical protein